MALGAPLPRADPRRADPHHGVWLVEAGVGVVGPRAPVERHAEVARLLVPERLVVGQSAGGAGGQLRGVERVDGFARAVVEAVGRARVAAHDRPEEEAVVPTGLVPRAAGAPVLLPAAVAGHAVAAVSMADGHVVVEHLLPR